MPFPNTPIKTAPPKRPLAAIVGAAAAAALLYLVPGFEGTKIETYRDIAGVLTYCTGATENAMAGKVYTLTECKEQLDRDLARHAEGVASCLPMNKLTLGQRIAFVDTAYNIGVAGFCGSTMAKLAHQGDVVGSCAALFAWNGISRNIKQADGAVVRQKVLVKGLILRRLKVIDICLTKV